MEFKDIIIPIGKIGDWFGTTTQWIISNISKLGLNITPLQSQILTLLIFGIALFLFVKFVSLSRKPLKILIVILFVFLIISIIVGFFV